MARALAEAAQRRPRDRQPRAALLILRRADDAVFSGVLEGDFGCSTKFKVKVAAKLGPGVEATGLLMFWVMATMVPVALLVGVVAGMREGSRLDRVLSILSIATTSTPEYVSGVVLTIIFATWLGWLNGSAASATEDGITFYNFTLPVVDAGDLRHGLCRAHDARLDGRGDERAIYPHRAAQGPWFGAVVHRSTRCATR